VEEEAAMRKLTWVIILLTALFVTSGPIRASAEQTQAEQRRLFREGARLWPVYCSQCHQARPGGQFSPEQWNAIMMHMRTQSEMPAKDARAILEYLKASR
jgi:mono/diheme cytochrome c family protein